MPANKGRGARRGYDRAMLLAVDIGNSNLTLGWFRGGTLVGTRRAATAARATTDELDLLLAGLLGLDGLGFADIGALAVASLVPPAPRPPPRRVLVPPP